jgi:hypothetical protein
VYRLGEPPAFACPYSGLGGRLGLAPLPSVFGFRPWCHALSLDRSKLSWLLNPLQANVGDYGDAGTRLVFRPTGSSAEARLHFTMLELRRTEGSRSSFDPTRLWAARLGWDKGSYVRIQAHSQAIALADGLTHRNGFATLLAPLWRPDTPLDWASGHAAFTIDDVHWHRGAREFHPSMSFAGLRHSPSSVEVYKPLLAGISRMCTGDVQHSWRTVSAL